MENSIVWQKLEEDVHTLKINSIGHKRKSNVIPGIVTEIK